MVHVSRQLDGSELLEDSPNLAAYIALRMPNKTVARSPGC